MTIPKSFSELRKQSKNLDALKGKLNKKDYSDDRFWRAEQDKAGNAKAVIRFLPPPKGEDLEFVTVYKIGFKDKVTNRWFIENCPSTINKPCPVLEHNNALWATKDEANIELARMRKRKVKYISNVLVVSDPANPGNEGKVFLFEYGVKIYDKIQQVIEDKFGDGAINPFCFDEGANFKLRISRGEYGASYEASSFDDKSAVAKTDAEMEEIWGQEYSLMQFLAEDQFKSYEDLEKKFLSVIGEAAGDKTYEHSGNTIEETRVKDKVENHKHQDNSSDENEEESIDDIIGSIDAEDDDQTSDIDMPSTDGDDEDDELEALKKLLG